MNYMQELDRWTDETVLAPIFDAFEAGEGIDAAQDQVRKAIRIKVLESYRNGAKRCPNCHGQPEPAKVPKPSFRRPFRRERR